jgi:hypothetical protein
VLARILDHPSSREGLLDRRRRNSPDAMRDFFQRKIGQMWRAAEISIPAVALAIGISIGRGR